MPLPFIHPTEPEIIKGTKLPIEQADKFRFVRGQGWTTIKSWASPYYPGIIGKANDLVIAGYTNIDVQQVGNIWQVEATIEGTADGGPPPEDGTNEVWEMDSYSESASIQLHPNFFSLNDVELRQVEEALQDPTGELPTWPNETQETLYKLRLRQVDTWSYEVPVVRHTMTPSPPNVRVAGFQEIWTPEQINATTENVRNMISEVTANNPFGDVDDHTFGWLNTVLRVTEDVQGRSQLTEEWMLANWSDDLYASYAG